MTNLIAVIDCGSGNLHSVVKALQRAVREAGLACDVDVTCEPEIVRNAERIVLPGVGAFGDCMRGLTALPHMIEVLGESVVRGGTPFLGICVGMQLMATQGLEEGSHQGLNWLGGTVSRLKRDQVDLKIPHMGWNELRLVTPHPVFAELKKHTDLHAYFVHSYEFRPDSPEIVVADTDYGGSVTAAVARDNMIGTQFHPEKSQALGLYLLTQFVKWRP